MADDQKERKEKERGASSKKTKKIEEAKAILDRKGNVDYIGYIPLDKNNDSI